VLNVIQRYIFEYIFSHTLFSSSVRQTAKYAVMGKLNGIFHTAFNITDTELATVTHLVTGIICCAAVVFTGIIPPTPRLGGIKGVGPASS